VTYITVNILQSLPMHNLNRDQNGLPKSQFDGGVQRARLSSQSLKRPARILFRESTSGLSQAPGSVRTKNAHELVGAMAQQFAEQSGREYDPKVGLSRAKKALGALAASEGKEADNILLFSKAELETLAHALVSSPEDADNPEFIKDCSSASLDVAAFGRMFAKRADLSTHAAVAVSHAVTTHPAKFTVDYFTAVDEAPSADEVSAGAAHIGLSYYTSGVYYRSFTIDVAQLHRSWSGIAGESARDQVSALVVSLIRALPTGKLTNTNAHTVPFFVYLEQQQARVSYEFETPVAPAPERDGSGGGYKESSVAALAEQVALAQEFASSNALECAFQGQTFGHAFPGEKLASIDDLGAQVANLVLASR
jgi:CRISPR system Cascade subunit CasC